MIYPYPKVYQVGHRAIQNLFDGPVVVEEKVDGSQFSFGMIDGELQCRSHGKELNLHAPEKMFAKLVNHIIYIQDRLVPGITYRGEYLEKPKHNVLAYDRVPNNYFIGFDIMFPDPEDYVTKHHVKVAEFENIGFECVPLLYEGEISDMEMFKKLLETTSILGGQKIEGVVVKNYNQMSLDKKVCMGKYVSEKFKEVATKDWKDRNPTSGDIVQELGMKYKSVARWQKAIQHLQEAEKIEGSPKDIGLLVHEVQKDIEQECADEIKEALFDYAYPKIKRIVTSGLPEWYKEQLLKSAFMEVEA